MAESELGVLLKQYLDRRIPDKAALAREIKEWQSFRNQHHAKVDWQFRTAIARIKLKHLGGFCGPCITSSFETWRRRRFTCSPSFIFRISAGVEPR